MYARTLRLVAALAVAAIASGCGGNGNNGNNGHGGAGGSGGGSGGDGGMGVPDGGPAAPSCNGKTMQTSGTWMVSVNGVMRSTEVHIPAKYDPTKGAPLILNFHGYSSNAVQEEILTNMNAKSDAAGYVVLYPEGTGNPESWDAGSCCGDAVTNMTDDIAFVRTLLDTAEDKLCIDTRRVYATGMSNGGFLSHRIGCELADRVAAIAPVAGVMGMPTCTPSRPMPVIDFHGTGDMVVPYNGSPMMSFASVADTISGWVARNHCTGSSVVTFSMMDSSCSTYQKCDAGVEVTLCTVTNGGHTWPGGTPIPSFGYTTPYLNADDAMWAFFQAHPMP